MKITIITVCFNSQDTIEETIKSVISQEYQDIEYIVIDGGSSDDTLKIIDRYKTKISKFISEKDNGMYDAINKGIHLSSGDIIGILNSDDVLLTNDLIKNINREFLSNLNLDVIFGDIEFINKKNKIIRKYSSKNWNPRKLYYGFMPAHPTFYCKKELYQNFGFYRLDLSIAADFELILRFFNNSELNYFYLPLTFVQMKIGGISTRGIKSTININRQILKSFSINGLKTNYLKIYSKYFIKIFELLNFLF